MSPDQMQRFAALSRETIAIKAVTARRQAAVDAAVTGARQQLAITRGLLAQLDAVLKSNGYAPAPKERPEPARSGGQNDRAAGGR